MEQCVLIVDDEMPVCKVGKSILEKHGYLVTTRQHPLEALTLFSKDPGAFDLIITDMTMPVMTGDKLCKEIHSIRPDVPMIICTGFSKKLLDKTPGDLGVHAFVIKPYNGSDLVMTVRTVLDDFQHADPDVS